ncbi:MAG TPA: alpha/beta fold hydrolase, partial [Propionibacteriaceae bacterium]|nr:alpha/beta fold hydrolase [Propionibacteriaceae bacterium]
MSLGPTDDLDGLDRTWSRRLTAPDGQGTVRSWHVLDNRAAPTAGTMLCVHGNPTWSYLWRRFLAAAPPGWRVVAVDQLGMGWSERPPEPRRLAERIDDLDALTTALAVDGPVVTVAHDWGGPISVGWALRHRDRLAGLVLTNTAVHHDPDTAAPGLIRLARSSTLRELVCVRTPVFVRTAAALSRPALPRQVRDALASPYRDATDRQAVGDFVADIPLEPEHPSRAVLDCVAEGLAGLADVPALLLWGARDPVFTERYLDDLIDRLPQADVQRYPRAAHLVTEDVPEAAGHVWQWVSALTNGSTPPTCSPAPFALPWASQLARKSDSAAAVTELSRGRTRALSFAELEQRIQRAAAGLQADGVRPGQRVALLVPPGIDLTVAVYACWRAGAVIVVADAGL